MLAVAVISFGLISLLGMMAYTFKLAQQADAYARLSSVADQVLAKFNSQPFSVSTNCATTNAVYYFTYDGLPTNSTAAFYQCDVANATPPGWTSTNMMQIQVSIRWPKPQFTNTNVIITSTLNYD